MSDAILSASVLVCAVVFLIWRINLEPYAGVLISGFIIRAGIGMLRDAINDLVGHRIERETLDEIRATILEDEAVSGAYDLILHSYGPDRYLGSVHVEVPDTMTAAEIDTMSRRIGAQVYQRHGVILEAVGVYSVNTASDAARQLRAEVTRIVNGHEGVLQMHGFFLDEAEKTVQLDMVLDFAVDRQALFRHIREELETEFPAYSFVISMDIDF